MRDEVYVSTDIETDGPIPGRNSMLSLGSVAFLADGTELGSFTRNLRTLYTALPCPETMAWWQRPEQAAAWAACRQDPVHPREAMTDYVRWAESLPGEPVFVAYPAGFDFTFVYWYIHEFELQSPFGFAALDIKSYAMAVLKRPYRESTKRHMPRAWFSSAPHTHIALDDAREQGLLFINMLRHNVDAM